MMNKLKAFWDVDQSVLAVDFDDSVIKMAEVKQEKGGKVLTNLVVAPLPEDKGQYKSFLENLFLVHGFSASEIYLLVGGRNFFFREASFPVMGRQALADTIKWEIQQYIPYEAGAYYYDFSVVEETSRQLRVMLAAGKKDYIDGLLALFSGLPAPVAVVDGEPFALQRLVPEEKDYIIGVAANAASRVILYQDARPVLYRAVSACGKDVRDFADQIHKAVEFYKFQNPAAKFDKVFFCGGADGLPAAVLIESCLKEPVFFIDPLRQVALAPYFSKEHLGKAARQAAAAIGLALREGGL